MRRYLICVVVLVCCLWLLGPREPIAGQAASAPVSGYLVCDEARFTPLADLPPLKEAFKDTFLIGAVLDSPRRQTPMEIEIATKHFSAITPENSMKPMAVQPMEGHFDFIDADRIVELAQKSGATPIGHCLVWHSQTPRWFFQGPDGQPAGRELALARLRKHIATVVGHYKDRVKQWDVVNEAISDTKDQLLRQSPWLKAIGEDYIAEAFRSAHEADRDAILIYNDYGIEQRDKRRRTLQLLRSLLEKKVPVHAVGIQGHWRLDKPDLAEVEESIKQFAELGLKVMITELDISVLPRRSEGADIAKTERPSAEERAKMNPYTQGLPDSVAQEHAERYRQAFALFLRHKKVIGRVTLWGTQDGRSWLNNFPMRGRTDYPLLFDRQGKPKAAFFAVRKAAQLEAPDSVGAQSYRERWRPQFHFSPAKNWTNDPNGMVYYDGEYHLFYQFNPFGDKWGHMSWGHAVSRDLVHWQHLPVALPEDRNVMVFSGSAVVDWKNSSGFGKDGKPPLVAIYTGHYTDQPLQNQHIAYSNDRGRTWTRYVGNPVLDIKEKDFRDPKVFWHAASNRWVMVVAWPVQRKVRFYASGDLKSWNHLSDFGPAGSVEGVWECPDLFSLADGEKTKWVLLVNVNAGAPAGGSGCQYFVGTFDGKSFQSDASLPKERSGQKSAPALWLDYGPDCYAAVTWSDVPPRDGRRLALGWMSNWQYANEVPTSPWRGAMTIPRELRLQSTADGLRLIQRPVKELTKLRGTVQRFMGGTLEEANAWIKRNAINGAPLEMMLEFAPASKGVTGLKLFKSAKAETVLSIDRGRGRISIDRTRSGDVGFHARFPGVFSMPLSKPDGRVRLHVFLDACSVEVFVNDGEQAMTCLVFPSQDSRAIELFGSDESAVVSAFDVWPLTSCWKAENRP